MDTETAKRIVDAQTARDVAILESFARLSARVGVRRWVAARPTTIPFHVTIRRLKRPTGPQAGSSRPYRREAP